MKDLKAIQSELSTVKNILITTHANPDADALGSSLGLKGYLDTKGHKVKVIVPTEYPDFLKWMPGNEMVVVFNPEDQEPARQLVTEADIIFCLDFSDLNRIDELGTLVGNAEAKKITVDHHQHPKDYSDWMIHTTAAASTTELIYDMIVELGDRDQISAGVASCLYAGLMTDTGSFRHSNTNSKVLHTAAALTECGACPSTIAKLIYDTNSANRLRFLGYALWELMQLDMDHGIGFFAISKEDYKKFNLQSGDTEGLVNYALSVKGIRVAALFKEKDGIVKISFRSVGEIPVNTFAQEYFNGGGHLNAAGGKSEESLGDTIRKFRSLIEEGKLN